MDAAVQVPRVMVLLFGFREVESHGVAIEVRRFWRDNFGACEVSGKRVRPGFHHYLIRDYGAEVIR